ncbi:MAG: LamG domain-containing protein, partial [Candidatus Hinthialibacter sp.]
MWEFNEGSGSTVTDNSGQYTASLGALVDLPVIETDSPSGQEGDLSIRPIGGLRVDDSENSVLDLQQGPMTAEVWVKPDQLNGWRDIFRLGTSIKAGFNGENLVFTFLSVVDINTAVPVPIDGEWHHIAYAWEPGVGVSFYLDGAFAEFVEETRAPVDFLDNYLSIGSTLTGTSQFLGMMDRLRIHGAVLTEEELDSDAANPKANLDSTIVAYGFDEGAAPYQSSTNVDRPAISMNQELLENSYPTFSEDDPKGEEGDFSMSFDGNDRIMYDDNQTFFFDFIDEPFTFEVWTKFKAEDQIAGRPIFFAYGVGGQGGYSFSFRPARTNPPLVQTVGATGQAGDNAIYPGGLVVDDSVDPVLDDLKEGPVTFEAWIKPEGSDDYQDFFRIGSSLKAGFSGNNPVFTLLGIVDIVLADVTVDFDGAWRHIAYVWEPGSGVNFYINGENVGFVVNTSAPRDYLNNLMSIGISHDVSWPFLGAIDRFRIHNAALTADQLDSDAANPKEVLSSTVV